MTMVSGMKGKDMVRQKEQFSPSYRQRPKSLSNPGFGAVERGLGRFSPQIHRVLALVQHFGVLRDLPSPQNRCLHRYGMAETQNCPFVRHTGVLHYQESLEDLQQHQMIFHTQPTA
jgi:hypothetical protein